MSLRDYQTRAVADIRQAYGDGANGVLLQLGTGGGKTKIMSHCADGVSKKGNQSAIIAHRQELILQTSMTLAKDGIYHGVIAPDSVIREAIKSQVSELGRSFFNTAAPVSCASIQTLGRRNLAEYPFKFLFLDEAHHSVAGTWARLIAHYEKAWKLGVTATPERLDGKGLGRMAGGFYDVMVEGPPVADLMAMGWLTRAEVWGTEQQFDFSHIDTESRAGQEQMASAIDKPSITGDAIAHYTRICPNAPAIAFCINIEHAKRVAEQFRAAGYKFYCIDGTMKDTERRGLIRALGDGRIHGLTSCEIINEGTDIPVVTAAILLRPTQSLGMFLQQIGRVLRPVFPVGSDLSTIESRLFAIEHSIKPFAVVLDHVGNCNTHGLPDDPRTWTLDGAPRKKKKVSDDEPPVPSARTCLGEPPEKPGCHAIYSSRLRACPACGLPANLTAREIEFKEGELVRIQRAEADRVKRQEMWANKRAQHSAKSQEDLIKHFMGQGMDIHKARARAGHIMRAREIKHGATTPDLITS